jgi:hypothetical protein
MKGKNTVQGFFLAVAKPLLSIIGEYVLVKYLLCYTERRKKKREGRREPLPSSQMTREREDPDKTTSN